MKSLLFFVVSFLASIIGAICGIGGGVIIKPVLDLCGLASVATISFLSGCTVLSMSCYSVAKNLSSGESRVDMKTGTPLALGGAVGGVVMRDRHRLAEDGMIVVVLPYSSYDHMLVGTPEIVTRGFIYVKEAEEMMEELKRVTLESVEACAEQKITDWAAIKSRVKSNLSGYLFKTTRRSPMILPVITEI